jgi:hypothetical protein
MRIRRSIMAAFGLLVVLTLSWPASGQEPPPQPKQHRLAFQVLDGLIYIKARVNGKRANLLLDSGSTLTVFSRRLVSPVDEESKATVNLAKGSVLASSLHVTLILGDSDSPDRYCALRKSAFVGDFQFEHAEGIVGNDVLGLFKSVTFDFKNSTLILEDR